MIIEVYNIDGKWSVSEDIHDISESHTRMSI